METREQKMHRLMAWIEDFRLRQGITPQAKRMFELSCEAFGEGFNLLRQLIWTDEANAANNCWGEINPSRDVSGEILEMVMEETTSPRWVYTRKPGSSN